jgi:MATE family multidrug resistance protein
MAAESSLFAGAAVMVGWLGATQLAAHAVAIQLAAIFYMIPFGLSQATTVRVGLAWGARDRAGARRAGWMALALALAFMSASAALFWLWPEPLIGVFLDRAAPDAAEAAAIAVGFLAMAAVFQLADGAQAVAAGALRGLSDTATPMAIALFGYWGVGMPLAYLAGFPLGFGGVGVWAGLAGGLFATSVVLCLRFHRISQRKPFGG